MLLLISLHDTQQGLQYHSTTLAVNTSFTSVLAEYRASIIIKDSFQPSTSFPFTSSKPTNILSLQIHLQFQTSKSTVSSPFNPHSSSSSSSSSSSPEPLPYLTLLYLSIIPATGADYLRPWTPSIGNTAYGGSELKGSFTLEFWVTMTINIE